MRYILALVLCSAPLLCLDDSDKQDETRFLNANSRTEVHIDSTRLLTNQPADWGSWFTYLILIGGGGYFYFLYIINTAHKLLDDLERWHRWRRDIPFAQLIAQPIDKLHTELNEDICSRYSTHNITDPEEQVQRFFQDVDGEYRRLKYFLWAVDLLTNYLGIEGAFPIKQDKVSAARGAMNKLNFMRYIIDQEKMIAF